MSVLIIAEHDGVTLHPNTASLVQAGLDLGGEAAKNIVVLIVGEKIDAICEQVAKLAGVSEVWSYDSELVDKTSAEYLAQIVFCLHTNQAAQDSDKLKIQYIMGPHTTFGKNVLPRIAALLGVAQLSDVLKICAPDTFERPIYAGDIIATVQSLDIIKVLTIRPSHFKPVANQAAVLIKSIASDIPEELLKKTRSTEFVSIEASKTERPELTQANIVVSGGRGLKSKENFELIEQFADKLGAAVGASRAAVDAGFIPNEYQVGQTGKVVAPDVYFAIGISGAIQHVSGIKDSKIIVAINQDANAPIFEVSDYGLVGDLFEIVPELIEKL